LEQDLERPYAADFTLNRSKNGRAEAPYLGHHAGKPLIVEHQRAPTIIMVQRRTLFMADERNPSPYRFSMTDDGIRRQTRLDDELQADPELAEGPAGGGKVVMYALGIAVLVGTVFYGLNNAPIERARTTSTAQNAAPSQNTAQTSRPAAPQGMREATPNSAPGVTTGAAPAQPQTPTSSTPTGQDINRSGNPPVNNAMPSK
jgi:hypothetical protein